MHSIAVIPGDGIGREVVPAAVMVLESIGIEFDFQYLEVGYGVCHRITELP